MGHDDRRRAGADRVAVDLADADRGAGQVSAVDGPLGHHDVLGVEQQDPQLLALQGAHRIDERLGDVGGGPDQPRVRWPRACDPPTHLGARRDAQCGGLRQARHPELDRERSRHVGQGAEPIEQPTSDAMARRRARR